MYEADRERLLHVDVVQARVGRHRDRRCLEDSKLNRREVRQTIDVVDWNGHRIQ